MAKHNSDILFSSVEILRLSKTNLEALQRLNILCIKDLLFHLPNYYIHKNMFPTEPILRAGTHAILKIYIEHIEENFRTRKPLKVTARVLSNNVPITLIFFRKPPVFIKNLLQVGRELIIEGKIEVFSYKYQISHPEFILNDKTLFSVQPIYPLTYGITQKQIYRYILTALGICHHSKIHNFNAIMPTKLMDCLNIIHYKTQNHKFGIEKALFHASLYELTANQLAFQITKKRQMKIAGRSFSINHLLQEKILSQLGFNIAEGQASVLQEIEQDQQTKHKMIRMLQGDVGSGKTLVALLSMINAVSTGAQAVLMAPTDLLANQHFLFFTKALVQHNIKLALLTGSTKIGERRSILAGLESGEIQILIGTHALFQDSVEFKNLGYIVIDEQHRFGVQQRLELINKSNEADLLVMTATPIPRTLALSLYGDMDVSRMNGKLRSRPPITTSVISNKALEDVALSLAKIIDKNEQIYWVCPLIENLGEETDNSITSVTERYEILNMQYPEQVGLLHGKLAAKVKNDIMNKFSNGKIKILVSTTVIEVGIDVAAASLIVIEHAEKFGLAQLHQLRGRVGRSDKVSYCILLYDNTHCSSIARQRLEVMKNSADGFEIAEQDLKLRGTGEMLGIKQSGDQNFIFNSADAMQSFDLIKEAQNLALTIYKQMNENEQQYFLQLFNKEIHNIESG